MYTLHTLISFRTLITWVQPARSRSRFVSSSMKRLEFKSQMTHCAHKKYSSKLDDGTHVCAYIGDYTIAYTSTPTLISSDC